MMMKMSEAAKAKKAEYMKEWRSRPENKEKQREYQRRYWERVASEEEEGNDD